MVEAPGEKPELPVCWSKECSTAEGGAGRSRGGGQSERDLLWQAKNFSLVLLHGTCVAFLAGEHQG